MLRPRLSVVCLVPALAWVAAPWTAEAFNFCVNNAVELENALNLAETNGQSDTIRLGGAIIRGNNSFTYVPPSSETFDLTLSGGWNASMSCTTQSLSPDGTVLLTEDGSRSLHIHVYAGDIRVENLSINSDGGLIIFARDDPGVVNVTVERNKFLGNSSGVQAALRFLNIDELRIRNNLIQNNFSDAATMSIDALNAPSRIYVINNTFWNNFDAPIGGLELIDFTTTQALIVNNLFWDNDGTDIDFRGHGEVILEHNNFETLSGTPDVSTGNLSLDPQFVSLFRPAFDSPMIDAGTRPPFFLPFPIPFDEDWSIGLLDYDGAERLQGAQVDIGAIEVFPEIIFRDGYE